MGNFVERTFSLDALGKGDLRVGAAIMFFTPFSCALDGIQVAADRMIGHQKLAGKIWERIVARFKLEGSDRALCISANPRVVKELIDETSKGVTNQELTAGIVSMPDQQLFVFEKQ